MSGRKRARFVASRAGHLCEYCKVFSILQNATFHIEHITPVSRNGADELENLCYSCSKCNFRKGRRLTVIDPQSKRRVRVFHPRRDRWKDHFCWVGLEIVGTTPIGRAMVDYFQLNDPQRIVIRMVERRFGLLPDPETF